MNINQLTMMEVEIDGQYIGDDLFVIDRSSDNTVYKVNGEEMDEDSFFEVVEKTLLKEKANKTSNIYIKDSNIATTGELAALRKDHRRLANQFSEFKGKVVEAFDAAMDELYDIDGTARDDAVAAFKNKLESK